MLARAWGEQGSPRAWVRVGLRNGVRRQAGGGSEACCGKADGARWQSVTARGLRPAGGQEWQREALALRCASQGGPWSKSTARQLLGPTCTSWMGPQTPSLQPAFWRTLMQVLGTTVLQGLWGCLFLEPCTSQAWVWPLPRLF